MSRDRSDADVESASNDEAAFEAAADEGDDDFDAASGGDKDQLVAFARELGVERNVKWALALGGAFAALLYVVFVVVPSETTQSPVLYLGLAFVVFFATSLSLTILFTAVSAWRRAREL